MRQLVAIIVTSQPGRRTYWPSSHTDPNHPIFAGRRASVPATSLSCRLVVRPTTHSVLVFHGHVMERGTDRVNARIRLRIKSSRLQDPLAVDNTAGFRYDEMRKYLRRSKAGLLGLCHIERKTKKHKRKQI